MSEIPHSPEFKLKRSPKQAAAAKEQAQGIKELAAAYARLFTSTDGKRVLKDLRAKYDPRRPRFSGEWNAMQAAYVDGQCSILKEIEDAMAVGAPGQGISTAA